MIRLSKHTYERVREAVALGRLCTLSHNLDECDICRREVRGCLRSRDTDNLWCLCEYHQQEVGLLW